MTKTKYIQQTEKHNAHAINDSHGTHKCLVNSIYKSAKAKECGLLKFCFILLPAAFFSICCNLYSSTNAGGTPLIPLIFKSKLSRPSRALGTLTILNKTKNKQTKQMN